LLFLLMNIKQFSGRVANTDHLIGNLLHRIKYGNCGEGRNINSLLKYLATDSKGEIYFKKLSSCIRKTVAETVFCVLS
jgi:hypothetical protein